MTGLGPKGLTYAESASTKLCEYNPTNSSCDEKDDNGDHDASCSRHHLSVISLLCAPRDLRCQ